MVSFSSWLFHREHISLRGYQGTFRYYIKWQQDHIKLPSVVVGQMGKVKELMDAYITKFVENERMKMNDL